MMQGSRIQEFGSEVEDMLSNEISLDRFYSKMIQNISLSDKVNHNVVVIRSPIPLYYVIFSHPHRHLKIKK